MRKFLVMLFLLSFVALVVGCGPSDVRPVSGKVTLDGEPLEGVSVRFTPKTGEKKTTSRGTTHEDGTYELRYTSEIQGALVGEHLVQIISETNEEDEEGGKKESCQHGTKQILTFRQLSPPVAKMYLTLTCNQIN